RRSPCATPLAAAAALTHHRVGSAGFEVTSGMAAPKLDRANRPSYLCLLADMRSRKAACAGRIFSFAASTPNHSARSTSGNALRRPHLGGHSISNELLIRFVGSK